MIKTVFNPQTADIIKIPPSKSEVHRLLICAALSDRETEIFCESLNEDIEATVSCLNSLGADISFSEGVFSVKPIVNVPEKPVLHCRESGSTLRFLLPLTAHLGKSSSFITEGRLGDRPLSPLKEALEEAGIIFTKNGNEIKVSGKCESTEFSIAGNVSSQFISGLIFMLTKTGGEIEITGEAASRPYIEMTIDALRLFGCDVSFRESIITVPKTCPLLSPGTAEAGGDWSNAAFFLSAGVIGKRKITLSGLKDHSRQGDRKIIEILREFGGEIKVSEKSVTAFPSLLHGINIDSRDIPDLVPVLSVVAANAEGTTVIKNCSRLRLKESDRIEAVYNMIKNLGGKIRVENDSIIIEGSALRGGSVDAVNDHRIAMSGAVAAFASDGAVTINGAEAVKKSYPTFWDEIR